jgi:putative DNA primase/helicase
MGKVYSFDFNDARPQRSSDPSVPPDVAFRDFIAERGYNRPEHIIQDGAIHRYGKKLVDWYVYNFHDTNPYGSFGCWSRPNEQNINWCYRGSEMSSKERAEYENNMIKVRAQINDDRARMHTQAREEVAKIWEEATEPESHPYLQKKNVKAHGIRMHKGELLIPMRDKNGLLHSLQRIKPSCEKLNWTGGAVAGHYHVIQGTGKYAYLCEGYATGATIHEATGATVYVAFSAGNMKTISDALPDNVIVAADKDANRTGEMAAEKTGRKVILPQGTTGTDFNDLAAEKGIEEVRRQLTLSSNKYTNRVIIGSQLHDGFLNTLAMGWTIEKVFPESSMLSVVFGPPSCGKSFTVLDMCCSIDSGKDWHGRRVKQKPVLYLAAEGQSGMLKRIEAWVKHNKTPLPTFALLPMPCLIDEDVQRRELINMIAELPQTPGVIVLDTLARSMAGDENSTSDMGKVVIAAGILIEETGAQVIIIHHTGKDETRGARGAIALTGATDTMFKVIRFKDEKKFILVCERQKDFDIFEPMGFRFEVIDTGFTTKDGDEVTSLVPEYDPELSEQINQEKKTKKQKLNATQKRTLMALREAIKQEGIPLTDEIIERLGGLVTPNNRMVMVSQWRKEVKRRDISSGDTRAQNLAFDRAKDALEELEYVGILDGYAWEQKGTK